jgi:hypothetical protein
MGNEWTVDRLVALPEGTVVAWDGESYSWALKENPDNFHCWISDCGDRWSSAEVFRSARPGSIRVVSVPIEALLSWGACKHAARVVTGGSVVDTIRAAVAHVTREA